jgi:hypothetical protein
VAEEVSPSRRRDLLSAGVILTATGTVLGPAERAARISRAITAATPDPLTLAQGQRLATTTDGWPDPVSLDSAGCSGYRGV